MNTSTIPSSRLPLFDVLRGLALILMAIYHFAYDLNEFQVIQQEMNEGAFWLNFRILIMSMFLTLVGVSLVLAKVNYSSKSYRKRLLLLAASATLITVVTYQMNPQNYISFGILHLIFVASLLGPILRRFPKSALILGSAMIALPIFYRNIYFFRPYLIVSGLSPFRNQTPDFAPFFPWLGVVLVGIFIGNLSVSLGPKILTTKNRFLESLGRHSLVFYMTHQLILYPTAWLISKI